MGSDSTKKLIVVVILAIIIALIGGWLALLLVVGQFSAIVIAIAVIEILFAVALIYFGLQRIKEIDEGSDDDVDNY